MSGVRRVRPVPAPRRRQSAGSMLPMLLLGGKLGWPLLALLAVYAVGGDDTGSAERTASAKFDAEEQLMRHMVTAGPAIERRLAQWVTSRDGVLFLREPPDSFEPYALHVLPILTPWRASCGEAGLTVSVAAFRKEITEVALDDRQCAALLSVVGRAMLSLSVTATDQPAPQPRKERP
jgi:hypothetical protein